jgi:photosystem II stability/assembly factor-like uncharacterized protein
MRCVSLTLLLCAALPLWAGDHRYPADAALQAVQFVDRNEGWAAGDEGTIWHTIDGGASWERQATGVRASLRSLHFLNPFTGWAAGREELPGGGSVGILLFTADGGLKWQHVRPNALTGLNVVRFIDNQHGFAAGDGSEQAPTGLFATTDAGRTWHPVPGPRCSTWQAADFQDAKTGALAGAWSRLATLRQGALGAADVDTLGGRSLRGLRIVGDRAVAVGQGGLVLVSRNSAGARWGYADLPFSAEARAAWDGHCLSCLGDHVWVAGRPGSVVLHSRDGGTTWEVQRTGQPLPINAIHFVDETHGWAAGELGAILRTQDGGKSWAVQRRGGQRAAALFVHANARGLPVDTLAQLGGEDGYLCAALQALTADPASSSPGRATDAARFAQEVRRAAGAAGESLWQFPLPQHLTSASKRELLAAWDQRHGNRGAEQLLRQLVLTLRVWRPNVVVSDHPDAKVGSPAEALLAEAIHEAFQQAGDSKAFREQLTELGLEMWRGDKLYGCWDNSASANVSFDVEAPRPRLAATARDFAAPAAALVSDETLPRQRYYRLLEGRAEATAHKELMQGVELAMGGTARRELSPLTEADAEILKVVRSRRNVEALAELPIARLNEPAQLLGRLDTLLAPMPEDAAARAAQVVAQQYARRGQWELAAETYRFLVEHYPAHPVAVDGYRWLLRYQGSSEARRRHELGQFIVKAQVDLKSETRPENADKPSEKKKSGEKEPTRVGVIPEVGLTVERQRQVSVFGNRQQASAWYQACLQVEKQLAAFGPLYATDVADQFCFNAARRQLGEFEVARKWATHLVATRNDGPWRDAAAAELWLVNRSGPPPKPTIMCRQSETRPFLDGQCEDPCWQGLKALPLRNAVGDTLKEYPTEFRLAFDKEYLYVALHCHHPADRHVTPVTNRGRDANVSAFDHVDILLDLDRDYATYYRLQIDQRGCVCDDCWGDRTWDPRWFVATRSEPTGWHIEAAIPLAELTGEAPAPGRAWAANVVRVLPGRGVQAYALPADVEPRPEGMGLLLFMGETKALQTDESKPKLTAPNAN